MPNLKRNGDHDCPFCQGSFPRKHLKRHLTSAGKKGLRCPALKEVIPSDVWANVILPHYVADAKLPDLSKYAEVKKSTGKKREFKRHQREEK